MTYDPFKNPKDFQNRVAANRDALYAPAARDVIIRKSQEDDVLIKGGEGSKGGKVIGHTKSGKAIYDNHNNPAHKDFTGDDHHDAARLHGQLAADAHNKSRGKDKKVVDHHQAQSNGHYLSQEKVDPDWKKKMADDKDGDKIKKSLTDAFQKGEISDSLASGYGAGSEAVKFTKTGKEIKEKIPAILSSLAIQKGIIEAKMAALRVSIGFDGTNISSRKYQREIAGFNRYDYNLCEPKYVDGNYEEKTDQNSWCSQYNSLCYVYCDLADDIDALTLMQNNLEDKKKYTLSVSQLIALNFN